MKLGPDIYHLNTFRIPKHEDMKVSINGWVGAGAVVVGATKKPPETHIRGGVLLARIKLYLQICTPTVIKTIPSCFLLNL